MGANHVVDPPRRERPKIHPMDPSEARRFLDSLHGHRLQSRNLGYSRDREASNQPPAKDPRGVIRPRDVVALCQEVRVSSVEKLVVLSLDTAGHLLDKQVVQWGLLRTLELLPREVFVSASCARNFDCPCAQITRLAMCDRAWRDIRIQPDAWSRQPAYSGLELLDHLIVGRRAFFSFKEGGLMGDDHPGSWKGDYVQEGDSQVS